VKEADGWYVSFSYTEVPVEPLPHAVKETGIDVGLKVFLEARSYRHGRRIQREYAAAMDLTACGVGPGAEHAPLCPYP
jgi:hypothetical protein